MYQCVYYQAPTNNCTGGRVYNPTSKACECLASAPYFTGYVCIRCDKPNFWVEEKKSCLACPANTYLNESTHKCFTCPPGTVYDALMTKCKYVTTVPTTSKCPVGTTYNEKTNQCFKCPDGSTYDPVVNQCKFII